MNQSSHEKKWEMKRCDIAIATVGVKIFPFGTVDHLQVPNDWSVGSRAGLPFRGTRVSGGVGVGVGGGGYGVGRFRATYSR